MKKKNSITVFLYFYINPDYYDNHFRGIHFLWKETFLLYFTCDIHRCTAVIMGAMASQINSLAIVYLTVYSGAGQRKHQSSASLAFVRGIHRIPVNSPHKWPVTRKMLPFHNVVGQKSTIPMYIVRHLVIWGNNASSIRQVSHTV